MPLFLAPRICSLGSDRILPLFTNGIDINQPNQVWNTDITYIPMKKGFLYLYAIIDVYSHYIVR
ncbi:MAG: hypothetical protein IKL19_00670 [Paludibacteraceae bacterium]|nr:hypothetical protein [Paludibacteraceae bacterium]MBR6658570.1 hypothetical protein [Paludibacteraceae bacterium]